MDRVEERASRYLEAWNEQYALVNETEIVSYGVSAAMSDIEHWIEGRDPNEARAAAGVEGWSVDELIQLYRYLAPSASFFCYTIQSELLAVTESSSEPEP
jgi:hypothetical protein